MRLCARVETVSIGPKCAAALIGSISRESVDGDCVGGGACAGASELAAPPPDRVGGVAERPRVTRNRVVFDSI